VNRFRGFLVPRPDWIKVLYLFGTLGLHRLLTKTLKFSKNFTKISKKFKISKKRNKNRNVHKTCSHHVHLQNVC
jgi:hypothetical protein